MNFVVGLSITSFLSFLITLYFFVVKKVQSIVFTFYLIWFLVFISFYISTTPSLSLNESLISTFALLFFVWLILLPPLLFGVILQIKKKSQLPFTHFYLPVAVFIINIFSIVFFSLNPKKDSSFTYEVVENVMTYVNYIVILFLFPIVTVYYSYLSYKLLFQLNELKGLKNAFQSNLFLFTLFYNLFIFLWFLNYLFDSYTIKFLIKTYFYVYFPISMFVLQKNRFNAIEEVNLYEKINALFLEKLQEEKLFLDNSLTIRKAAKMIGTNEKYLSNAINKIQNESFSSIVNKFRVEFAQRLLLNVEYENYTIESIGNISGFNSKSNFNSVFKKATGLTPSEFKNKKGAN